MNTETLSNQGLGKQGEAKAADFLAAKGYKILERNYRAGHQELDIIASENDILHFVEVKTRRGDQFGIGEDAMHKKKINCLLQAIDSYLTQFELEPEWQLDLLVVELRSKIPPRFIHYESIGLNDAK